MKKCLFKLLRVLLIIAGILGCGGSGSDSSSTSTAVSSEPVILNADEVEAANCSYTAVQKAVLAARPGGKVFVPAGTEVWNSALVITKGLTLQGAGQGKTIIVSGYSAPHPDNVFSESNYLIVYKPQNNTLNEPFRITGFTFDLNNRTSGIMIENLSAVKIDKIRIDNNAIKNATYTGGTARAIQIHGTVYGVIDSNRFSGNHGHISSYGANDLTWNNIDFHYGSPDCMYYEDNTFSISDTAHSAGAGGRYCARYNTYNLDVNLNVYPWYDIHGNMGTGGNYSAMGAEIYGNLLVSPFNSNGGIFDHRGGKAVIFSNKISSTSSWSAKAREEYDDNLNYTPNPQPQHVSDSYYWNNRYGSILVKAYVENSAGVSYPLTENTDFFNYTEDFDGSSGVGCGTLPQRPSTCTTGVGYWATNQSCSNLSGMVGANPLTPISGTLYKCTAPDTWTAYYTPYTYPHPLRTNTE